MLRDDNCILKPTSQCIHMFNIISNKIPLGTFRTSKTDSKVNMKMQSTIIRSQGRKTFSIK